MKILTKVLCVLMCAMLLGSVALAEGALEKEKVVIGTNAEFPPFEYIGDNGSFEGFDMELIAAILDGMGVEYEYTTMNFNSLLPALSTGKIDVVIAAMTIKDDRRENALFSDPYFHATQKILVKADNDEITSEADLDGKKVGVQMGTTGDIYITGVEDYEVTVERFDKALDAVMDLSSGRLDAVVVDEGVSSYFMDAIDGLKILDETLSDEQYGIAVRLDDEEFAAKINEQLAILIEDGTYDEIFAKHFSSVDTEDADE